MYWRARGRSSRSSQGVLGTWYPIKVREAKEVANVLEVEQHGTTVSDEKKLVTYGLDTRFRKKTGSHARNRYQDALPCTAYRALE
jgi:hypothetical protein